MNYKHCPRSKLELRNLILDKSVNLGEIDTSLINDMSHLFEPTLEGEQVREDFSGIGNWDTSNVVDMSYMFCYTTFFNESILQWDVSRVTSMRGMFQFATKFNQPLKGWNVGYVQDMGSMFYDAESFNQDLSDWNISKVRNMRFMFMYARSLNIKPAFDLSKVEDQTAMFYGTPLAYVDPNFAVENKELEALAKKEHDSIKAGEHFGK